MSSGLRASLWLAGFGAYTNIAVDFSWMDSLMCGLDFMHYVWTFSFRPVRLYINRQCNL